MFDCVHVSGLQSTEWALRRAACRAISSISQLLGARTPPDTRRQLVSALLSTLDSGGRRVWAGKESLLDALSAIAVHAIRASPSAPSVSDSSAQTGGNSQADGVRDAQEILSAIVSECRAASTLVYLRSGLDSAAAVLQAHAELTLLPLPSSASDPASVASSSQLPYEALTAICSQLPLVSSSPAPEGMPAAASGNDAPPPADMRLLTAAVSALGAAFPANLGPDLRWSVHRPMRACVCLLRVVKSCARVRS